MGGIGGRLRGWGRFERWGDCVAHATRRLAARPDRGSPTCTRVENREAALSRRALAHASATIFVRTSQAQLNLFGLFRRRSDEHFLAQIQQPWFKRADRKNLQNMTAGESQARIKRRVAALRSARRDDVPRQQLGYLVGIGVIRPKKQPPPSSRTRQGVITVIRQPSPCSSSAGSCHSARTTFRGSLFATFLIASFATVMVSARYAFYRGQSLAAPECSHLSAAAALYHRGILKDRGNFLLS